MFGTSIHWTTFFLLLIDLIILIFAIIYSTRLKHNNINRFLILSFLFVLYNFTGGFLPYENFPGPFILQYIVTYSVSLTMGIYLFYYIYKEYDIRILESFLTIKNLVIYGTICFLVLFLLPYFITNSVDKSRVYFTIPISAICIYFFIAFYKRLSFQRKTSPFALRRNRLSLISVGCMALLPVLTVIGDYQWLTFPIVNTSLFLILAIEIDRYIYLLENRNKMIEVFDFYNKAQDSSLPDKFISDGLTRREIEIAVSILDNKTYKDIGEEFFIAEKTVSKHASNIFKKTNVHNRAEFLIRFGSKAIKSY